MNFKSLRRALLGLAVIASSTVAMQVSVASATESDGTVDLSYGSSGVKSMSGNYGKPLALSSGKVVVFATVDTNADSQPDQVEIKRFTTGGDLDTNFGLNGTMTIAPAGHTWVQYSYSFADANGGFYVVYTSNDPSAPQGSYDAGKMRRITSAGVQDLNFGTNGEVLLPAPAGSQTVGSQWIDATSGNMYTIQYGNVSAIAKQNSSGVPDTTFGANSKAFIDWPYSGGCGKFWRTGKMAIWVDPSETYALVAAFIEKTSGVRTLGLAKFKFSTRSCDTTFGGDYYLSNGSRGTDSTPDGFFELDVIPSAPHLRVRSSSRKTAALLSKHRTIRPSSALPRSPPLAPLTQDSTPLEFRRTSGQVSARATAVSRTCTRFPTARFVWWARLAQAAPGRESWASLRLVHSTRRLVPTASRIRRRAATSASSLIPYDSLTAQSSARAF